MASPDRLPEILEAIEQSLDEPDCDGDALAARLFLSRYHFSRLASAVLGEAPGAFRRRILLERAAHRLVTAGDAVIEVGLDAGYSSPDAFARAFHRAHGISPSGYRRSAPSRHDLPCVSEIHSTHLAACGCPELKGATACTSSSACSITTSACLETSSIASNG